FCRNGFWNSCVPIRKSGQGSCDSCWRRGLAGQDRMTASRKKWCCASCVARRSACVGRPASLRNVMVEQASLPTGTKPEGATSEQDASRKVREMFTRIAPRYDLLNHLLSVQMDKRWRARTSRELRPILDRADAVVLDLCCGTGDLAFALSRDAKARIVGADFSHTMLVLANQKNALQGTQKRHISFLEADALSLPLADGSFDLVTAAFGFRNLANYEAGLREIFRILKPGGTLGILEFTEPAPGVVGHLYRF